MSTKNKIEKIKNNIIIDSAMLFLSIVSFLSLLLGTQTTELTSQLDTVATIAAFTIAFCLIELFNTLKTSSKLRACKNESDSENLTVSRLLMADMHIIFTIAIAILIPYTMLTI